VALNHRQNVFASRLENRLLRFLVVKHHGNDNRPTIDYYISHPEFIILLNSESLLSNRHTHSAVFGRDLEQSKAEAERLSHMTELVLGCLLR
jgi:GT2 family glycosyltransferase